MGSSLRCKRRGRRALLFDKEILMNCAPKALWCFCERLSTGACDESWKTDYIRIHFCVGRWSLFGGQNSVQRRCQRRNAAGQAGTAAAQKEETFLRMKLHRCSAFPLKKGRTARSAAKNVTFVSALSNDDPDDDPLAWLLLDQHIPHAGAAVYRQVCTEELEQLFHTLSAKDRAILGHTYGVFGLRKAGPGGRAWPGAKCSRRTA